VDECLALILNLKNIMRLQHKFFAIVLPFFLISHLLIFAVPLDQGSIQNTSWQSYAGGIDISAALAGKRGKSESIIKIYIKNTSTTLRQLIVSSKTEDGILVYIVDRDGTKYLLHDRDPSHGKSRIDKIAASMGSVWLDQINPGEIISREISISTTDLDLLKAKSFQFNFSIRDPNVNQTYKIESATMTLTGTVITVKK
jgi:hypothetical protein